MSSGAWRVLAALLLLFPGAAAADDAIPDLATIRTNIEHAAGPNPEAFRATYETTFADGTTRVQRVTRRGDDDRTTLDMGPFHTESGTFKGQDWYQNDNGAIKRLSLANLDFTDFVGYRVTSSGSYAEDTDGIIGTTFLRMFTLGLDYGNSRVYLTPNSLGRRLIEKH